MSRSVRYLTFEGRFESDVLGVFRIIRGFANLKALGEISVPYEMAQGTNDGQVEGRQRQIDPAHAERIRRYLESGEQRFMPGVILSLCHEVVEKVERTQKPIGVKSAKTDDGITVERVWKSQNIRASRRAAGTRSMTGTERARGR